MAKITSLTMLSEMDKIQREKDAPSMPPNYIIGTKFTDKTANGLEKCIVRFINLIGGQAERIKNAGRMIEGKTTKTIMGNIKGKSMYIPGTGTNGTPDVRATFEGRSIGIEVKIGKDRMSDKQNEYAETMTKAGGVYFIAKDFTTFVKWWDDKYGRSETVKLAIARLTK